MQIIETVELGRKCHIAKAEIDGKEIEIKVGKVAEQAGGSALVTMGGTVVLATACMSDKPREGVDFFPLVVDYTENMFAAGKIPGGFFKRGGRPTDQEILRSRMIDRPIRPLFPKHTRNEIQVLVNVLSADGVNSPDILGIIGASTALMLSHAPFDGPIAAVRVGMKDGETLINPPQNEIGNLDLDLVAVGTSEAIMMVEASATEVSEEQFEDSLKVAWDIWGDVISAQIELAKLDGKPKREIQPLDVNDEVLEFVRKEVFANGDDILFNPNKAQREGAEGDFRSSIQEAVETKFTEEQAETFGNSFDIALKEFVRDRIVSKGVRPDGRAVDEIRKIDMEAGPLPNVHGSGLFLRGQTQVLSIAVLGSKNEGQLIENLTTDHLQHYMHYYSFPPFSVGEVRPMRGPSRRDKGHGNLAEKALLPLVPDEDTFPYAIQVFSNVLESNGSSSMASVCGSSLALMDAGVPLKKPVAGIAMGLIAKDDNIRILTDIQGVEDALGDMDFKVAGTRDGITAIQMDIKLKGINMEIIHKSLAQAREGRLFILNKMSECLDASRPELSDNAPRVFVVNIDSDKIRDIIGQGGKVIKKIIEDTECKIDVEQDGTVYITAPNKEMGLNAKRVIEEIVEDVKEGKTYLGKVTSIRDFGAFVDIGKGGKEGLLHISEIANYRVNKVEDELKIGQELMVMVKRVDDEGKIALTKKGLIDSSNSGSASKPNNDNHHDKRRKHSNNNSKPKNFKRYKDKNNR
jgi:polyribonucleotide nucleotidyltransferase